jgi:uncharacterized protein (DUF433 family)
MGGTPSSAAPACRRRPSSNISIAGETIGKFLDGFPSVTREQVVAFREAAKVKLVESVA